MGGHARTDLGLRQMTTSGKVKAISYKYMGFWYYGLLRTKSLADGGRHPFRWAQPEMGITGCPFSLQPLQVVGRSLPTGPSRPAVRDCTLFRMALPAQGRPISNIRGQYFNRIWQQGSPYQICRVRALGEHCQPSWTSLGPHGRNDLCAEYGHAHPISSLEESIPAQAQTQTKGVRQKPRSRHT